jgi:hypothetical protein
MLETQAASSISVGISLIGLLVLTRLFRAHLVDDFRDQLFTLRDELFLYACDEGLLGSAPHANLRLLLNGMIRYAHRASLARLIVLNIGRRIFRVPLNMPPAYAEWVVAVAALPSYQAERLREFHDTALMLAARHMMSESPMLWLLTIALGPYFIIWRSTRMIIDATAKALKDRMPSDLLEAEALNAART